jgi:hypothetical protein
MAIAAELLRELPIPENGASWETLAAIGQDLVRGKDIRESTTALEETVWSAYRLDSLAIDALQRHFSGFLAPEGMDRFPHYQVVRLGEETNANRFGAVIDVEEDRLRLWAPGLTSAEGDWVTLPPRFLGWHSEAGATFELAGPDLESALYGYQQKSYLGDRELTAAPITSEP